MTPLRITLLGSSLLSQLVDNPTLFVNNVALRFWGGPALLRSRPTLSYLKQAARVPILQSAAGTGRFDGSVLHILTNSLPYSTGGYAYRSQSILKSQLASGLRVQAVTRLGYPLSIGKRVLESNVVDGVEYKALLPTMNPLRLQSRVELAAELVAEEAYQRNYSVLHTTTPWINAAVTARAAKKLGIPWVYEIRGEPEATWAFSQPDQAKAFNSDYYRISHVKETQAMRAAASVVVLSEISRRDVERRGVQNVKIVPNSIDTSDSTCRLSASEAQTLLGLPLGRYVGAVSSLVDYEGFDELIRALQYLPPHVRVLLVGSGPAEASLKEIAHQLGLSERVKFVGRQPQEEISKWYCALDVFAMPRKASRVTEIVTPLKSLRAQAVGIPVVASDLPALREVTRNSASYVQPSDAVSLAEAIEQQLSQERRPPEWLNRQTWDDAALKYLRIYESL